MRSIKLLYLETTNRCNASCLMCTHQFMKRKPEDMNLSLLENTLKEANPKRVIFHLFGEPLLYRNLEDAISYAKKLNIRTMIDTNGQLLTKSRFSALEEAGLDNLVISFGASTKEVYEKIWRGLNYQKVTKNIINAWQERKKTHIQIRTIVTEENKHQIRDINKEWSQYCDVWTPVDEFHLPGYDRKKRKKTQRKNCKDRKRLNRECVVKSNGDVVLCCNDLDGDYVIGNVKETPILDIWNSPEFELYRKRIYKKKFPPPICEECVIRPW